MEPTRSPRRTRTRPFVLPLDPDVEPDLPTSSPRWPRVLYRGLTVGELIEVQQAEAEGPMGADRVLGYIERFVLGFAGDLSLYGGPLGDHPPGPQQTGARLRSLYPDDVTALYWAMVDLSTAKPEETDPLGGGPRS